LKIQIGQHVEYITAIIANINEFMILGREWLSLHNPTIDWKNEIITFGENCVKENHCSQPTTISTSTRDSIGFKSYGVQFIDEQPKSRKIEVILPVEKSGEVREVSEYTDRMEIDSLGSGRVVTLFPPDSVKKNIDGGNSEDLEVTLFPSGDREDVEIDYDQSGQSFDDVTLFPSLEGGDHVGNRRDVRFTNLDGEVEVTLSTPRFLESVADVQREKSNLGNEFGCSWPMIEQSLDIGVKGLTNPITKGNLFSVEVNYSPDSGKVSGKSIEVVNNEVDTSGNVKKEVTLPSLPYSEEASENLGWETNL